jgi:hypothetical protein
MFSDNSQQPGNNQCGHDRLFWNGHLHCSDSGIRDPVKVLQPDYTLMDKGGTNRAAAVLEKAGRWLHVEPDMLTLFWRGRVAQVGTAGRSPGKSSPQSSPA